MKTLPVMVIVCVVMTLTGADARPRAKSSDIQTAKSRLIKRSLRCLGWFEYNGRCFLYIPKTMTWAEAEKNCQSLGGNLASVHDVFEYHEIQRLIVISTNGYPDTWIGGSDAQQENFWLWSDGTPFQYLNWNPGEPNNQGGSQSCLIMNFAANRGWDDEGCNVQRPSVCTKKTE